MDDTGRSNLPTDPNFGELTLRLISKLESVSGVIVHHNVSVLDKTPEP
jgi:hypothetical protein